MKKTLNLKRYQNLEIKVGDRVCLIDGSALSCEESGSTEVIIIMAYPELTHRSETLKNIIGEVVEVGVTDKIVLGVCGNCYLQDIVVKIGDGVFRTASELVSTDIRHLLNNKTHIVYKIQHGNGNVGHLGKYAWGTQAEALAIAREFKDNPKSHNSSMTEDNVKYWRSQTYVVTKEELKVTELYIV